MISSAAAAALPAVTPIIFSPFDFGDSTKTTRTLDDAADHARPAFAKDEAQLLTNTDTTVVQTNPRLFDQAPDSRCTNCQVKDYVCDLTPKGCSKCKLTTHPCVYFFGPVQPCTGCLNKLCYCDRNSPKCTPCLEDKGSCTYPVTYSKTWCLACRQPGRVCDKKRPSCSTCKQRKDPCKYTQLQAEVVTIDSESDAGDTENPEYEVDYVLKRRSTKSRGVEYLVKWKGYKLEESTWEPEGNLVGAKEVIQQYEEQARQCKVPALPRKGSSGGHSSSTLKASMSLSGLPMSAPNTSRPADLPSGSYTELTTGQSHPTNQTAVPLGVSRNNRSVADHCWSGSGQGSSIRQQGSGILAGTGQPANPLASATQAVQSFQRAVSGIPLTDIVVGGGLSWGQTWNTAQPPPQHVTTAKTPAYTFVAAPAPNTVFVGDTSINADIEHHQPAYEPQRILPKSTADVTKAKAKKTFAWRRRSDLSNSNDMPLLNRATNNASENMQHRQLAKPTSMHAGNHSVRPKKADSRSSKPSRKVALPQIQAIHIDNYPAIDMARYNFQTPRVSGSGRTSPGPPSMDGKHSLLPSQVLPESVAQYLLVRRGADNSEHRPLPEGLYTKHNVASNILLATGTHPWLAPLNTGLAGIIDVNYRKQRVVDPQFQHEQAFIYERDKRRQAEESDGKVYEWYLVSEDR